MDVRTWSDYAWAVEQDLAQTAGQFDPDWIVAMRTVWTVLRDAAFIQPEWTTVEYERVGHVASFSVALEPLRIGDGSDHAMSIHSLWSAQAICDAMGWVLPTPTMMDAIAMQADSFIAAGGDLFMSVPGGIPKDMASAREHSERIDARGGTGLIAGPWKEWILEPVLWDPAKLKHGKKTAINYGFYTKLAATPPGSMGPRPSMTEPDALRVYQQPGQFHPYLHRDYSQKLRPVFGEVLVTGPLFPQGQVFTVGQLAAHPDLWPLVSRSGPFPDYEFRDPWLEKFPQCAPDAGVPSDAAMCSLPVGWPAGAPPNQPPPAKPPRSPGGKLPIVIVLLGAATGLALGAVGAYYEATKWT